MILLFLFPFYFFIGYPDYYPQKIDQEEDQMGQYQMRYGFSAKKWVDNEFCAAKEIVFHKHSVSEFKMHLAKAMNLVNSNRIEHNQIPLYVVAR